MTTNNQQRRLNRYEKRYEARVEKKNEFLKSLPSYEEIFSFENLMIAFWNCRKTVTWKPSIQMFTQNLSTQIVKLQKDLFSEEGFKSRGFIEFDICERGKMRHIQSVDIRQRVVQRCFCDNYLVPLLSHNLIYDNGASLKGKGVTFAQNRLAYHLRKYYNKYKTNEGYILLYDFSKYFNSIVHTQLYKRVDPLILDERCRKLYHHLIDAFGDVGLGLGSQVSQVSAVSFPNELDHHLESRPETESYARYMDDGYMICHTLEDALRLRQLLFQDAEKLKLKINSKKVKIVKINRSFIFLKRRFFLTQTGQVVIRLCRENVYKHRRKIKKTIKMVDDGILTKDDIVASHKSWYGQVIKYKNYKSVNDIDKQVWRLIDGYNKSDFPSDRRSVRKSQ